MDTLICLSVAWLARAQTPKSLPAVLSGNGISSFSLYLAQFPSFSDQVRNGSVTSMFSSHIMLRLLGFIPWTRSIDFHLTSLFAVLAPSDAAIAAYLKSGEAVGNYSADLQALLQYHVIPGRLTRAQLKQTQQFLPTLAKDTSLVNVTGGQKLQIFSTGQQITFQSGLKRNSSLTSTVCCFSLPCVALFLTRVG